MNTEVTVALIGFAGAVGGALLNAYSAELKSLVSGRLRANKDLVGDWDCLWSHDVPVKDPSVQDTVTIEKVSGETLRALGHTPTVGKYRLTGRISPSSLVTFIYEGLDERHPLGGVVILELNAVRDEMAGHWYEYTPQRTFMGGATRWKRRARR